MKTRGLLFEMNSFEFIEAVKKFKVRVGLKFFTAMTIYKALPIRA